ncbi:MAG: CinA family protein [Micavibrio sp.]|nr:CinA family protein [Micavibrio sp.]
MGSFALQDLVKKLSAELKRRGLMLATAESCTGGLVASAITRMKGSSAVFERGFVTYSNEAKIEELSVDPKTIQTHGAVSLETAGEMAFGALSHSHADITVSITGIAGPSGGSEEKPTGTVCFALAHNDDLVEAQMTHFQGSRTEIQDQAVDFSLTLILNYLSELSDE